MISKRFVGKSRKRTIPPRIVAVGYHPSSYNNNNNNNNNAEPFKHFTHTKRFINLSESEIEAQRHLKKSRYFKRKPRDLLVHEDCEQQYDWQITSFPSCNDIHELDFSSEAVQLINNGYWRDVWMANDETDGTRTAFKTIRYEHDFTFRNLERHRRDALVMERLTKSPHVVDIFGYCGHSSLSEYSDGGDINEAIFLPEKNESLTKMDKLTMALHVATGIAHLHNFDREGRSSVAHTDITPTQFILVDGIYKLNDFNRCRLLGWNKKLDILCTYTVGNNPKKFRSPEEYRYDQQDEKVDIYSMGNVFYVILTGNWPFRGITDEDAQKLVMEGKRPHVDPIIKESNDPVDKALLKAMEMCHGHDPKERASAREVYDYLTEVYEELELTST